MKPKSGNRLTLILAIGGAALLLLPFLAALVFGLVSLARSGLLHFDYMIPGEVFPLVLLGGALLLWAALRAGAYRRLIAISLGAAVLLLVGGQTLAVVTGLADGSAPDPERWMAPVMASILLYDLGVLVAAAGGILLARRLFAGRDRPAAKR